MRLLRRPLRPRPRDERSEQDYFDIIGTDEGDMVTGCAWIYASKKDQDNSATCDSGL